jgi:hypothetical protein
MLESPGAKAPVTSCCRSSEARIGTRIETIRCFNAVLDESKTGAEAPAPVHWDAPVDKLKSSGTESLFRSEHLGLLCNDAHSVEIIRCLSTCLVGITRSQGSCHMSVRVHPNRQGPLG